MPTSKEFIEMVDQYGAHNYHPLDVVISRAEGVWVYDPEGNKYLDCLSAYSSQNAGHCHPEIVATLKEQADIVTLTSRAFHNNMMGLFLKMLAEVVGPHINDPSNSGIMSLPMNTGTEAVSTGLKVARAWGYIKKKIPKNEAIIIMCRENFHGRNEIKEAKNNARCQLLQLQNGSQVSLKRTEFSPEVYSGYFNNPWNLHCRLYTLSHSLLHNIQVQTVYDYLIDAVHIIWNL